MTACQTLRPSFEIGNSAVAERTGALSRGGSRFRDKHSCRWGGAAVVAGVRMAPFCPGARDGCSGDYAGEGSGEVGRHVKPRFWSARVTSAPLKSRRSW